MQVLRATTVTALLAVLLVLPSTAAVAAVHAWSFTSPEAGEVLTRSTPLQVHVRWNEQRPDHVDVRVVNADGAMVEGTDTVRLSCTGGNCDDYAVFRQDALFGGASIRPATLAPFGGGGPACNGAYGLQARPAGEGWGAGTGVVLRTPPSAPGDVTVTPGTGRAEVSWAAAPQPDVVGYTIQRRQGSSGTWQTVAEVGAGTTTAVDRDAPAGSVQYRVTTFRGDGVVDGQPVAACADDERDLATAAAPVGTTVAAPSTTPTDGGSSTPGDGGSTTPDEDGATGSGDGDTSDTGDADGAGEQDTRSEPQPAPQRRAPSTSLQTQSRSDADVSVPDVARSTPSGDDPETYYGEDEGFSEELDFGELGSGSQASSDEVAGAVSLDVPGGLGSSDGELALRRVLAPVAGGLIMLGFGLHLRRWTRDALT